MLVRASAAEKTWKFRTFCDAFYPFFHLNTTILRGKAF